eukprot:s740_g13.t1
MEEVEVGWLRGPLQRCNVPFNRPISRRFGLRQQKGKVRPIDDYIESGVNSCVATVEAPVLHTVDTAAATLMLWFDECNANNFDPKLEVRTFDLTSSYRQVALSPSGKRFAFTQVFDLVRKRVQYCQCCVLPFGVVRSVHSFLRLARAIWWLGAGRHALGELQKKQIIFETETLAAVVACFLWKEKMVNKRCLLFVDNEGAKFSLLKGIPDNITVDLLSEIFAELEAELHANVWPARVPSKSNIADPPSRGDIDNPFFHGAFDVSVAACGILDMLVEQLLKRGEDGCPSSQRTKRVAAIAIM